MTTVSTDHARAALATRPVDTSPLGTAKADLAKMRPAFEMVLPPTITADRMIRVLQTVLQTNPDLARPQSRQALLGAAMTCAQLGLDPTPAIGHAYIIPFKGQPTFVLGYKGAIFLAADNGVHFKAWAIHSEDEYDVQLGTDAHITHKLPPFDVERGPVVAYYCVATFADGSPPMFDVMTLAEVERIRQASPGRNSPAWSQHFDEMAKKTVLKRLAKSVPIGVKVAEAVAHDGATRTDVAIAALDTVPLRDSTSGDDDTVHDGELEDIVDPETGEIIPPGVGLPA